ncbi:MAG: flagellar biosynthetic protein FliO [SAR324 cluster bacterium]|nr:flagellar biosynthetic protein FliO [SAR324 cluster bacterium]
MKSRIKFFCLFWLLLIYCGFPLFAQQVLTLKSIDVQSLERVESIRLGFDQPYEDTPLINFEPGSLNLRFDSLTIDPVLPSLLLPESNRMIKAVRAFQTPNTQMVQLDIILQSSRLLLEHPEIVVDGSNMILNLQLNLLNASSVRANTNQLMEEIGEKIRSDAEFPSTFTKEEPPQPKLSAEDFLFQPDRDWVATMVTLVLSLLLVLLLIYLLAMLYNRFLSGHFPALKSGQKIKVVSTYHIAPKQKVMVIQINEQFFACGVTPTSINLISELKDSGDQSFLAGITEQTPAEEIDIDRSRAEFMKALEKAREQARSIDSEMESKDGTDKVESQEMNDPKNNESGEEEQAGISETPGSSQNQENTKFNTPVKNPFTVPVNDASEETNLNPAIQDFASKLSQRLRSLKPIK